LWPTCTAHANAKSHACTVLSWGPTLCRYVRLVVIPKGTPVPMRMLAKLWDLLDEADAEATSNMLEERGVMRVAHLFDGSAWALVAPEHLEGLEVRESSGEAKCIASTGDT
jgi:hypothetical protein